MKTEKGKGYACSQKLEILLSKTIGCAIAGCTQFDDVFYEVTYKRIKIPKGKKK